MAHRSQESEIKKRKLDNPSPRESPIISLNVGGTKRDVPRSILHKLRDASCVAPASLGAAAGEGGGGGGEAMREGSGNPNPLCDLILMGADHWSDVPTTSDSDGNIRIYIDRNPQAFGDLLSYIEYGAEFLYDLIHKEGSDSRLRRLRMEGDYFTVEALSKDVDEVMYGKAVSFRSDDWFSVQAQCEVNNEGEEVGWGWKKICGNESIATLGRGLSSDNHHFICDVQTTGTYLVFTSLHSLAVTPLSPGQYYGAACYDECVRLSVKRKAVADINDVYDSSYTLVRCGAFDYRRDKGIRRDHPNVFTAAATEALFLKKGNQLDFKHGHGTVEARPFQHIELAAIEKSPFSLKECHCANFLTLIRIFGDSLCKWNVKWDNNGNDECVRVAEWTLASDDLPKAYQGGTYLDENDSTKIRFLKAGYYLLLGRIAAKLRDVEKRGFRLNGSIELELSTNGGSPLHVIPEVVSFWTGCRDVHDEEKLAEYGHLNDIVYAERDSYISVRATREACFAQHGTAPALTRDKIPTQSLTAMRLDTMRIDRYQVSIDNDIELCFKRALGGEEASTQAPLFTIKKAELRDECDELQALEDFQCIIIGCISSRIGNVISLCKNGEAITNSQICKSKGHGYGSHALNTVVCFKMGDRIRVKHSGLCNTVLSGGHMNFLVL